MAKPKKSPERYITTGKRHNMVLELQPEDHERLLRIVDRYRGVVGKSATKVFAIRQLIRHHDRSGRLPKIDIPRKITGA